MKRCSKCHTVYSSYAAVCPKCGIVAPQPNSDIVADAQNMEADKQVKRDWVALLIGIPALIGALYLIIWLTKLLI